MRKESKKFTHFSTSTTKELNNPKGKTFQAVFYFYAIERFLYCLASSQPANNFILREANVL
jgi:hypothetical protein